ncbi:spore germination protein [Aquibacillus koreensis]|uniref:Spore germination protein n=1 Tax=Aquibacillus koreensis TaxID=279446 RepID=A0A9X3WMX3_9BACI|nr:spore germination protein [Aquibacillus koreensis]MCT2535784.1 spore germination protein [Aquibacillus koreensis]MDC3420239.1 spore germination protein [Aquibacillus koreensis]
MEVNHVVKPNLQIRAFYLFFIILNIQTGLGILGAPRHIFQEAKQDAWISVLIGGVIMHVVVVVMVIILKNYESADILGIQVDVFGTWIGKALGTVYILYIFGVLLSSLINYIQIVQVFIYPQMPPWLLGALLILLIVYTVLGGFRVAVGVTFVFFFLSFWLFFFLYEPARLMDLNHFKPMLEATPKELLFGSYQAGYSYVGLEILFFIYPFIENKKKISMPVHAGVASTTILLLVVTVISVGFFTSITLEHLIWPALSMYKIIEYPIIERFDLIVVTQWAMVIFPNFILFAWLITYSMKRLYGISQRKVLYTIATLLLIGIIYIKKQTIISQFIATISNIGFIIAIVYPVILLPLVLIKRKLVKMKEKSK